MNATTSTHNATSPDGVASNYGHLRRGTAQAIWVGMSDTNNEETLVCSYALLIALLQHDGDDAAVERVSQAMLETLEAHNG